MKGLKEAELSMASGCQYILRSGTAHSSLEWQTSYEEAPQRVNCNLLYNPLAWLTIHASPEVAEDGRVKATPEQHEKILNLA